MKRILVGAVAALVSLVLMAAAASADTVSAEDEFVARLNEMRATQGLSTLAVDPALTDMARTWSAEMASAGGISHNPNLAAQAPSNWMRLGENVGVGPDVLVLHEAFAASPHHYANMVEPSYTKVGVGVVEVPGGMFVTVDFMTASGQVVASVASSGGTKVCTGKGKKRRCKVAAPRKVVRKAVKKKAKR